MNQSHSIQAIDVHAHYGAEVAQGFELTNGLMTGDAETVAARAERSGITHNNVFTDTSSAKSIIPNLIEWAVREIGADRILFGTDSPVYFAPMQRARIDCALMDEEAKRLVLRDNALRLFSATIP